MISILVYCLWRVWAFVAEPFTGLGDPRPHIPHSHPDLIHFKKIQCQFSLPDDKMDVRSREEPGLRPGLGFP